MTTRIQVRDSHWERQALVILAHRGEKHAANQPILIPGKIPERHTSRRTAKSRQRGARRNMAEAIFLDQHHISRMIDGLCKFVIFSSAAWFIQQHVETDDRGLTRRNFSHYPGKQVS